MSATHVKKFMNGKMTPAEAHRALGIRKRCAVCGQPAAIRIKVYVPLKEMIKRNPDLIAGICATNPDGPFVPTVKLRSSRDGEPQDYMKVSDVGACDNCKSTAEKEAALGERQLERQGMTVYVEIDRKGLERSHSAFATQVPGNIR